MTIYDQDYMAELKAQDAAYSTGVKDPVAVGQEAVQAQNIEEKPLEPIVDQSIDAGKPIEQPAISDKEFNFKALREELAQIKADKERLADEFEELKRSQYVQRQPEPPRKRVVDDINNDDLVTGAQFKQAMAEREADYQLMLGELQVKSQHSDYDEVTSKYGVPLIQNEPDLAQGFMGAQNKASYLYRIGKMAMEAERRAQPPEPVQQAPQASRDAQRIVENARKPGTLSNSVGGSGSLSKADYYATMSEADFQAMVAANLAEV